MVVQKTSVVSRTCASDFSVCPSLVARPPARALLGAHMSFGQVKHLVPLQANLIRCGASVKLDVDFKDERGVWSQQPPCRIGASLRELQACAPYLLFSFYSMHMSFEGAVLVSLTSSIYAPSFLFHF